MLKFKSLGLYKEKFNLGQAYNLAIDSCTNNNI